MYYEVDFKDWKSMEFRKISRKLLKKKVEVFHEAKGNKESTAFLSYTVFVQPRPKLIDNIYKVTKKHPSFFELLNSIHNKLVN